MARIVIGTIEDFLGYGTHGFVDVINPSPNDPSPQNQAFLIATSSNVSVEPSRGFQYKTMRRAYGSSSGPKGRRPFGSKRPR